MDDWMHATNRDGIASVAGLRGAGLGRRTVIAMVKAGVLTPLAFGWYASGPVLDDGERHVLTTRAMLRAYGGRVVAGHHSALLLLGLPTLKADLGVVRQSRRTTGPTRVKRSVRIGRAVPATFQSTETVIPAVQQVHGDPYSQGIADLLRHADGRHESPGETRLAHALRLLGIAATPQVRIPGSNAVVDFRVDGAPAVIEFDGQVKYGRSADEVDPFGRRRAGRDVLWHEKRREDRLRELGYEVVRVVWSDLDSPQELATRIRRASGPLPSTDGVSGGRQNCLAWL